MSASTEERINVKCPHCNKLLKAPPTWIGKNLKCPGCAKTFTAKAAAAAPVLPPSSKPQFNFVEDRKGKAEVKAFFLAIGVMLGGAALAIVLWYAIGSSLKKEVNWFAFPTALLVGGGTFLVYKRADVTLGMLAAFATLGVIIFSRFLVYSAMADSMTEAFTVQDLSGPKAVAFQEEYDKQEESLPEYTDEQDPDGEKAIADRTKLRTKVAKEIASLSDSDVRKKILDADARDMDSTLFHEELEKAIHERGYALDTATRSAYEDATNMATDRLAQIPAAEKKARYLAARKKGLLESLPRSMAALKEARDQLQNPSASQDEEEERPRGRLERMLNVHEPSAQNIAAYKSIVEKMSVEEMIVAAKVTDAEQFQVSLNSMKRSGAKLATGLSFLSPRIAFLTITAMGLAFTTATGGKFKD